MNILKFLTEKQKEQLIVVTSLLRLLRLYNHDDHWLEFTQIYQWVFDICEIKNAFVPTKKQVSTTLGVMRKKFLQGELRRRKGGWYTLNTDRSDVDLIESYFAK